MHLRQNSQQISLKCIVKNLSWRETRWQMVFLADSDLFHIIETRKSSFSLGLFELGWKYQGRTVTGEVRETRVARDIGTWGELGILRKARRARKPGKLRWLGRRAKSKKMGQQKHVTRTTPGSRSKKKFSKPKLD